jgi:hypothetical protein
MPLSFGPQYIKTSHREVQKVHPEIKETESTAEESADRIVGRYITVQ